jgi:hypothetical protein
MTATISGSKLILVNFGPISEVIFNKYVAGENKYADTSWKCISSNTDDPGSIGEIVTFKADRTWTRPDNDGGSTQGIYLFIGDDAWLIPKTGEFMLDICDVRATLKSDNKLTIVTTNMFVPGNMTETFEKVTSP